MSSTVAATSAAFTAETRTARRSRRVSSRAAARAEIVALIVIALALIAAVLLSTGRPPASIANERVRVERGQTLWELASQHPVPGLTTEQAADAIGRLNDLEGGRLTAGASIRIPVEDSHDLLVACR